MVRLFSSYPLKWWQSGSVFCPRPGSTGRSHGSRSSSSGPFPYQNWLQQWSKQDEQLVELALVTTGMTGLADRALDTLSGGQRQRAWIAMALAQDTEILLLDEPTTFLDLAHRRGVGSPLRVEPSSGSDDCNGAA